jgi:hypothetical protein
MKRMAKLLLGLTLAALITPLLAGCDTSGAGSGGQLPKNNGPSGPAGGNGPGGPGAPGGNGPAGRPGGPR